MIDVKDHKGNVVLHLLNEEDANITILDSVIAVPLNNGSVYHCELMASDYIKLVFSLPEAISLRKGCYIQDVNIGAITLNNHLGWFILNKDAKPQYNAKTGGYDYELEMVAWYYAWNRYILKLNPEFGAQEASFSLTTTMLDPSTGGHLGIIKKNIEHYFKGTFDQYDGLDIRFEVMYKTDGVNNLGLVENVAKAISYDNVRITDALSLIAQTYECEWWVEGNVIFFGRCDKSLRNDPRTELNIGEQVASLSRANSSGEYATRIYAFGSTRNVSARYRKSLILDVKETGSVKRNYPDDNTEEWRDRNYVIDTSRKIQPIWYDPACRVKASKSTLATLPGLLNISVDSNRKRIETSSTESVCTISKGSVKFKPIVNVTAVNCNSVSVELVLDIYDTDNKNSGNLIQQVNIGPVVGVNEAKLDGEYAATVSDTCYVFSTMYITVEGAADGCKVSCVAPMMTISEDNYYISTNLNVLNTDNNIVRTIPVIANPFFDLDYSDEAARLYLPYGESLAIGTRFTLDNVIKGKVPVECFTDDLKRDTTIIDLEKRLMLPLDTCPGNYVDSPEIIDAEGNVVESEIVESVVVFEDVYPKKEVVVTDVSVDTQKVPNETDENPDGKRDKYLYRLLIDKDEFFFDSKYILSGGRLSVAFQSDKLAGMEFEVEFEGLVTGTNNNSFLIINNENYGVELPNAGLFPSPGDKVVFFNYDVSLISDDNNSLVSSAEKELYDKTVEYLKKSVIEGSTYTAVLMGDYAYGLHEGVQDKMYAKIFSLGDAVHLGHEGYFGAEGYDSRIIGIEIKIDIPYDSPSYTIGESSAYSRFSELEGKISQVKSSGITISGTGNGGGSSVDIITSKSATKPTDSNVYSALASDERYLSRKKNDTAKGKITFEKDADFGQFVSGIVGGAGGRIDSKGNAELESLVLRSFLEVPELRFNRIDVVSGELWNSIAFGTIASVTVSNDGKGGTAWVHLEKTERCGLKVGDICRGIFSDFGDGKPKDENEDDNGFQKTYGFSTAYFTPTAIIRNEEGEFGFQYSIQAGTKVHPCAYMKFAVYGSFTDPSRRASAYFTRSYMRYLKNVQTWKIMPDDNIASQFGKLDGLTIGGMQMKGEGTFLSNIYMTGAVIQFSPEQKKELMGQDAYSVVLSDYEAVLHVSADGFVRDINKIREVVASNGNVMAMKDGVAVNVTDLGYNAATAVQVYKGKSMMHHAPIVGELAFTIVPVFYNCEGFVANGVLVVNKIVNPEENAYVDMEVNCEGFAVFTKHYAITVIKDASSPVVADLDNEMDTVVENPLTGDIIGSPLTTTAHMHYGTDEMTIVSMSANLPLPNGIACEVDGSKATISVSKDAGAASAISFRVVGKTAVSETLHTREVRFIANKVKSQYQLKLVPSVAEVKVDADGTFNGSQSVSVKCQVLVNDGTSSLIPDTYEALKGYRARMFYGVNVKSDVPDFANEVTDSIYADGVAVTSSDDSVTFWLYYYPNGINVASGRVRFDMETIHVLHDASDSFTQFVFKRVNADSVAAPKGGSYSSPLPDGWSDGVPAGSAKLWMSSRRFTSNGKNQDDAWSTPRPMTDTADFDVCFHDAVPGDDAPSAPPRDMHPTQTGMSGNNGWYDDGKTTSEWMAMATCSNGVWSDWSVVKIVGESPVIADIDNEMDGIGVGSDGILDVATSTSTNVCMYHGSRLMQIRSVSVSDLPSGVTASTAYPSSSDHSRCTVTFTIPSGTDFSIKNRYAITITVVATYNDVDYTRSLTYTLLGTTNGKDGEVYYLQPSTTAVKRNKDLVYSPSSVTCARYVKKGTSDAVASTAGELTMSTDGGNTWDAYKSVSNFSGISSIIYRWMLNGVEIDRETVPVISDGIDGKSNVIADIDNEMDSIITDVDGNFSGSVALYANVSMWYGATKLALDEITFSSVTGVTSSGNKSTGKCTFSVTSSMSDKAVISITVKATHNGTQYVRTLTFTISKVKQGSKGENAIVYAIKTSVSAVKVDKSGNVSPSSVSASVTKTEGGSTQTLSSLISGMSLQSSKNGSSWSNNPSVDVRKSDTQVYFRLMLNGVEIDHETVPVVIDGVGIKNVTKYYALSTSDEEVPGTWGTSLPTMTSINKYLWCYEVIIYTDGTTQTTDPIIIGVYGERGKTGKFVRYCGTFVEGGTYCGSADETGDYIDIVYHEAKKAYLQCVIGGTYTSSGITTNQDNPSSYNWLVSSFEFVATKVLFAETAYVRNLALVNMLAGYYNSNGKWVPVVEINGKGELIINSSSDVNCQKLIARSGSLMISDGVKDAEGNYARYTILSSGGIGSNEGFSLFDDRLQLGGELGIEPNLLEYKGKQTTWEKVIGAANGIQVKAVSALPSVTEANVLYVVI